MKEAVSMGATVKPTQVLANELLNINDDVKRTLPQKLHITRRLSSHKRRNYPKDPQTLQQLEIPESFKWTDENRHHLFLLHDSGNAAEHRFIIYACKEQMTLLSNNPRYIYRFYIYS